MARSATTARRLPASSPIRPTRSRRGPAASVGLAVERQREQRNRRGKQTGLSSDLATAGRTAEWFRAVDRITNGGTRIPPLPAMAAVLSKYGDAFQLAVGPRPLWPAA